MTNKSQPLVLMILDGFGYRADAQHNAINAAHTPQWDQWWSSCPHVLLDASGLSVGLPLGQMGNSEVGHMHIGAGRVIFQELTQINLSIQSGEFAKKAVFLDTCKHLKQTKSAIHIMGLLSDGGVHSHIDHLLAFLDLCVEENLPKIYLHLFLDGRDTPPRSAEIYLDSLQKKINLSSSIKICSITGRYYAMDRDQRWERIEPVYRLIVEGSCAQQATSAQQALHQAYQQGLNDEFVPPTQIGEAIPINDHDAIFFFNFRADRARQLTQAIIDTSFTQFVRTNQPNILTFLSMTQYSDALPTQLVFPKTQLKNTFGEVIANTGLKQLRLAETEKYAHVTFFFNGGLEPCFTNEERLLIPSPKVRTYDLKPEMSAASLTKTLIKAILDKRYDVIICNYANADMVGHTGDFNATTHAIEALDQAMHEVWEALLQVNGRLFITADHGNAECMFDEATQQPHTAHTNEPVPFLCVNQDLQVTTNNGTLSDIAPTLLNILGIAPPDEMTGKILMVKKHD